VTVEEVAEAEGIIIIIIIIHRPPRNVPRPFNIVRTWNRPHGIASRKMWGRTVSFRGVSPQDERRGVI
jgi:hypothetical protein